ncbi:13153_t:CDS:10, partial [Acaulospora colombiana]
MCTSSKSYNTKLFNSIADFLTLHTIEIRKSILDHDDVVSSYAREFANYKIASESSSIICEYLNRLLLKNKNDDKRQTVGDSRYKRQTIHALTFSKPISKLAYLIWKERVVYDIKHNHSDRLMYQIFESIRRDRDGEEQVPDVVAEVIRSFVELNFLTENPLKLYVEEFEEPYLEKTRQYYERESALVIANGNISQYMKSACKRLEQEVARNKKYCNESSHSTIIKECETQYVAVHQSRIHSEFESMISNERFEDCTMAYNLLSRIPSGVNQLLEIFEKYITNIGQELIARMGNSIAKDPREYVESLMDHHTEYMNLCQKVFDNDPAFVAAVDKAFRTIVNDTNTNPLAHAPEASCGVEYTSKLQKMFTDITISTDINNSFADYMKKNVVNADVKLNYLDKRYEFSVSLHQLGVLLLFNNADSYSFKDIRDHTGLNDQELKRVMKPMIDLSVFLVIPNGILQDDAEIKLNMDFTNKRNKIKISSSLQTETPQENDATRKAVDEDRKLYLQ